MGVNNLWKRIEVNLQFTVSKLVRNNLNLKRQPHKMVKHIQTIRYLTADELIEYVWPFCGVGP